MKPDADGVFIGHEPCESCGSLDNVGRYLNPDSSTSTYCFGCGAYHRDTNSNQKYTKQNYKKNTKMIDGEYKDLIKRKIKNKTCKLFNYQVGTHNGQTVHIANYKNKQGETVAQHIRYPNKDFTWIGTTKDLQLFGQSHWRDKGKLVITEGEIDAMSVSTVHNDKYPVVSIPNGAKAAKKSVAANIEWIEGFDEVIFMFDNDEEGRNASVECCNLLTPSKAKIATLPLKDASDMLVAGRGSEITDAIFGAKVYRPDGIISGEDTWDLLTEVTEHYSVNYPWNSLNEKTHGLRRGELVTFCGGSGIGKSQVTREIAFDLIRKGEKVGIIALEENVQRSIRGLVSLALNRPIHLPEVLKSIPEKELKKAWQLVSKNCAFYDHWGSTNESDLLNKVRYLAQACDCKWIILDHISIVVSSMDGSNDERRAIDAIMTKLRGLVENLQVGLLMVSHLRRPEGKGHEDGAAVSLSHLRSSHAIAQLSDIVCSLSRNVTAGDNNTEVRVLKNRFTGETGLATVLQFNKETNRMTEADINFQNEVSDEQGRLDY